MPFLIGAVALALLCLGFAWRAYARCRRVGDSAQLLDDDPFEQRLLEREQNLELNLALRSVQVLGRVSLFGGTGLGIAALTGGREYDIAAALAFVSGLAGWGACGELKRRIGSLADSWRSETNRRRRRQGVDQPERTG